MASDEMMELASVSSRLRRAGRHARARFPARQCLLLLQIEGLMMDRAGAARRP
ncbi:MAG: hypothetical protein MZV65_30210 [Chromatiales bacterium]|nr:hypothetical protein [Chromatiales bacterium]